jgi:hypothetical protein
LNWKVLSWIFLLWPLVSVASVAAVILNPLDVDLAVTLSSLVALPGAAIVLLAGPQMLRLSSVMDHHPVQDPLSFHVALFFACFFFFIMLLTFDVPAFLLLILLAVSFVGAVELFICGRSIARAVFRGV